MLGLFAGVVADRIDTRRLVIATQAAAMLVSIVLAAVTLLDVATLPLVYLLATLGGVTLVFDASGRQTLTFQMVGPRELPNAVALNSGLFNASRVIGPMIAGVADRGGRHRDVLCGQRAELPCGARSTSGHAHRRAGSGRARRANVDRRRRPRGSRVGLGTPSARVVMTVVAISSVFGFNFHVLVPLLAADTLDVGPKGLGLLSAAFGGGAVIGALAAASRASARSTTFLAGAAGFSITLLALAPVTHLAIALPLLVVLGICFTLFLATANSLVQLAAPDHLRGRVISIYLLAFAGLAPAGGLIAGALTELGGTRLAFAVAGVVGLAATAWAKAQALA